MRRDQIAKMISVRLAAERDRMRAEFQTPGKIASTHVDNLLPTDLAHQIYRSFPPTKELKIKRSIKELKHYSAQMNSHDPIIEETLYAFQNPDIVSLIEEITGLKALEPDSELYAGGISVMTKGGYLRPHLDNSHDSNQARYRVLNALYYVTPQWAPEYGGSLQLWDNGPLTEPRTIPSLFNRLVLMVTNRSSWHSVNTIVHEGKRCCVSNYYFSAFSPEEHDYFHATSFRGESRGLADRIMQADNTIRTGILARLPGVYKNPHVYKK